MRLSQSENEYKLSSMMEATLSLNDDVQTRSINIEPEYYTKDEVDGTIDILVNQIQTLQSTVADLQRQINELKNN